MIGEAWAQAGPGGAGGPPALVQFAPWIAIFAIFWFVLLRPEQKRRREHAQLLANLKRNDQVVMTSGLHGRVVGLADKTVTVEIAPKVQVVFERESIQTVAALSAPAEAKEKA